MKAVVRRCYGPPEVLAVEDIEKPVPRGWPASWSGFMRRASIPSTGITCGASPTSCAWSAGFGAPKDPRVGVDFAGTVEAVGKGVTKFKPGDEVFGGRNGALAEYVTIRTAATWR